MLHEQKSLIAYWEKVIADHKPLYGICSVTGKQTALRKLHSKIKIGGASAGGGSLISYNKSAHDSYLSGEKTVAAVGQRAEFGYRTAINYLLGTKNNCARIGDDYLIFWTKKRRSNWICRLFKNFFEEEKEDTLPTNIKSAIEALKQGKVPDNFPEKEKFCLAILAPNSGRVFVKNFSDQPLTDMFQAVAQHCKDTALEGYPVPTIPALAWASVSNKGDGAPHGSLYKSLLEAILTGEQYPMSAVLPALALCHKPGTVPRNRLALVKGYVNRHYRSTNYKEVPMGLDRERANIGYLLGRMLAVADAIHETSVGNPNRSLSDRFRGAFGSTPQFVFAEIAERTSIHLSKIKKEKPGLGIELDKQYSEILDKMNGAPVQLSLEEQIEFALGYQHQHQARFNKRSVANA
jgi:CRISPR-associated protein Csd1